MDYVCGKGRFRKGASKFGKFSEILVGSRHNKSNRISVGDVPLAANLRSLLLFYRNH